MRMVRVLALAVGCFLLEARAKRHLEANIVNVDASHVHGTNSDVQTIVVPGNNSDVQEIVVINGITGDTWTTVDAATVTTVGQLKSQVRKNLKAEPLVVGPLDEPLVVGPLDKLDLTMPDLQPPRFLTDTEFLSNLFAEQGLQHNAEAVVQLIYTRMVFVKVLNWDTHRDLTLKTQPTTMTVGEIKRLVEETDTAVDFKRDALYFDGNILEDEQVLQEFIPNGARKVEFALTDTPGGVVFVTVINAGTETQLIRLPRVPTTLTVRELKALTLTVKPEIDYAYDDLFLNGNILGDGEVLKDVIQEGARRVELYLDDKP